MLDRPARIKAMYDLLPVSEVDSGKQGRRPQLGCRHAAHDRALVGYPRLEFGAVRGRAQLEGRLMNPNDSPPVRLMIDFLCLLTLFFSSSSGAYLITPGIELALAPKEFLLPFFYGPPILAGLFIAVAYVAGTIKYRTNWIVLVPFVFIASISSIVSVDLQATTLAVIRFVLLLLFINAYVQIRGAQAFIVLGTMLLLLTNVYSTFEALFVPDIGVHTIQNSRDEGLFGDWRGIFLNKNGLGQTALVAALPLIFFPALFPWRAWISRAFGALCIVNLVMSSSATAEIAFIVSIIAYNVFLRRRARWKTLLTGLALSLTATVALTFAVPLLVGFAGRDMTFSNRTFIWNYVLDALQSHAFLGYGFGAGANYIAGNMVRDLFRSATNAHNGYLEIALECGYCGVAALLFAILSSLSRGLVNWRFELMGINYANRAMALFLVAAGVSSWTEAAPLEAGSTTGFMTFAAIVGMSRRWGGADAAVPDGDDEDAFAAMIRPRQPVEAA